jgi:hypothetical protein
MNTTKSQGNSEDGSKPQVKKYKIVFSVFSVLSVVKLNINKALFLNF